MTEMNDKQRTFMSILMASAGFFLFSIADTCVKYLGIEGYDSRVIQLYASTVATVIGILYVLIERRSFKAFFPRKSIKLHLLRSITLVISVYFLIDSLKLLDLAEFYSIAFLVPFLVSIGAAIFFGEKIGLWRWVAIIGGFSGVLVSVSGQLNDFETTSLTGIIYGLIMVFGITLSYMLIRKIGRGEYPPLFPLYAQAGIFIMNLLLIFIYSIPLPVPPLTELPIWLLYGVTLFGAVMLVSNGFANAPIAAIPSSFQYTQIIWGVLFGYVFFANIPRFETIIGLLIIMASGLFMIYREYKTNKIKP